MADTRDPDNDQMIADLKAAGWEPKGSLVWKSPSGMLYGGVAGSWKVMKAEEERIGREIRSFGGYQTADAEQMRPLLRRIGASIGKELPAGWGFNLLLFTYGEAGSLFYISSAERGDVIKVMKEYIAKFERDQS